MSSGVASRSRMAVTGSANAVTMEPNTEMVWPAHSFRKSG